MGHLEPGATPARLKQPDRARRVTRWGSWLAAGAMLLASGCAALEMGLFSGQRPDNLGVKEGRLQAIDPSKRNAVSSFAQPPHQIEPLATGPDPAGRFDQLVTVVRTWPRATLIDQRPGYLRAEFRSRLFGFVDDVEFLLDPAAQVIHVRSASRLGYSDLGVNRERIEQLRSALAARP